MIEIFKLSSLPLKQQERKILKILETVEKYEVSKVRLDIVDDFYLQGLFRLLVKNERLEKALCTEISEWIKNPEKKTKGALINKVRHALYTLTDKLPSEWDLILPEMSSAEEGVQRPFIEGLTVYAEDIRTPFNIGSIFRTAEAFGVEKIVLSEQCVSPDHVRAQRSAMGCIKFLPWERGSLSEIPPDYPVFALETGGTPISSFTFPKKGLVIIGSEELGVSPEALKRASAGVVSIPMQGTKASINVGVAFGILMHEWVKSLSL